MLILSRNINESIMIGNDIEIKILSVQGEQVKLGINAPKNIEIHRKEVYLTIKEENEMAANIPIHSLEILKNKKE